MKGTTKILIGIILIAVIVVPVFGFIVGPSLFGPPIHEPSATKTPQATNTSTPSPTSTPIQATPTENAEKTTKDTEKKPDPTPIPRQLGPIESAQSMNSNVWLAVGANAWNYFRPSLGVDGTTGLPCSGSAYPYFTDWDLGVYIQAVIDASKLGLISNEGDWGFNNRTEKVLNFLENRELNSYSYPYWFYQAVDGGIFHNNSDVANFVVDTADTGRLLVALSNLKTYNGNLSQRIDNFVYNIDGNRSDYWRLVPALRDESLKSTSIYTYYVVYGFASFWPELAASPDRILDNIYASGSVNVSGVTLPKGALTSDVLLSLMFETNSTSKLTNIMKQVYLAHEAYNRETGQYRAFGEGASASAWQWGWVVSPDNRTWIVLDGSGNVSQSPPMIYTKVAFGFLALYNSPFAKNMSSYIEHALYSYSNGYGEGVDESKFPLYSVAIHTNGLILDATWYAVENRP